MKKNYLSLIILVIKWLNLLKYMIKKGVNPDQVKVVGCGSKNPIADNTSENGRA